jgi:O-antigen/teichoic acid export membrane protein
MASLAPSDEVAPKIGLKDIKVQSVRGGTLTFLDSMVALGLSTVQTIVLARLLTPGDFGLVAIATAITAFAGTFSDFGLSAAIIQREHITHGQVTSLFWVNSGIGLGVSVLTALAGFPVAWFYHRSELQPILLTLSLTFLLAGMSSQHRALLRRQMLFFRLTWINITANVVAVASAIGSALMGAGFWSLVIGTLVNNMISSTLLILGSGWMPGRPFPWVNVRDLMKFGAHLAGFNVVNYFARNLDSLLIGKFYGSHALGLYSRAYQLLMLPISRIRDPLNAAAMPGLSRLQGQPEPFRQYYRRISAVLAMVTMPLVALLAVSSEHVVNVLLGPNWSETATIFQWMAIAGFIQPVASLRGLVLVASGQTRLYFRWGLINAGCCALAFLIGIPWGAVGVASAYAVQNYLILYPSMALLFGNTEVRIADFHHAVWRPAVASFILIGAAWISGQWLKDQPHIVILIAQAVSGGVAYLFAFCLLPGGRKELASLLGNLSSSFLKK